MKIGTTNSLISQNVALSNARSLVIFDSTENKVCNVALGNLGRIPIENKLYSFGTLSDVHIQYDTAQLDFQKALTYLNNTENVEFTCVCGDLVSQGIESHMNTYKQYVDTYSPNTPVYAISGNHECYSADWTNNSEETVKNLMETYTGKPLYYSFEHGDDVFIMLGVICANDNYFGTGALQWLYETLETNRNKRCFVFQHIRPDDACGNAYGIYATDIWTGTHTVVFENLMKHYKNVIFFHGHSHLRFGLQTRTNLANIDTKYGMYSVHIPSLASPSTGDITGANSREELYSESEGYVVDVYENGIHLRGRDFVREEFLPIASYWLDTTLQIIEANTFTDSTGTITT